eukprot:383370_1
MEQVKEIKNTMKSSLKQHIPSHLPHVPKVLKSVHYGVAAFQERTLTEEELEAKRIEKCALKVLSMFRLLKARKELERRKALKAKRKLVPVQDEHGHMNPTTIKILNKA